MQPDINGISLGEGTALLFQHGLTANVGQVKDLVAGMNGLRLLSIDCPGHGSSPLPIDYQTSFDNYADEVIGFLDRTGISKAIFGGISMGSGIAVNIALRYAERVRGLFLVRPAWLDQSNPQNLQILLPAAELRHQPNGQKVFCELKQFQDISPEGAAQSVLGVFSSEQQPELSQVIRNMVKDRPFTSLDTLSEIKVPTMVIGNDQDPLHPFAMAEKISQSIPGSVLRKVTSRYIDHSKHAEQLRTLLKDFIKDYNLY